jgi:hypothetical protein
MDPSDSTASIVACRLIPTLAFRIPSRLRAKVLPGDCAKLVRRLKRALDAATSWLRRRHRHDGLAAVTPAPDVRASLALTGRSLPPRNG